MIFANPIPLTKYTPLESSVFSAQFGVTGTLEEMNGHGFIRLRGDSTKYPVEFFVVLATPDQPGTDPKGDAGKLKTPLHLVPPVLMDECAKAMGQGAEKYGAWNFRHAKVNASTYVGALMRHLNAWRDGEDIDPESGVNHLGHAAANLAILLDTEKHGTLVDDRPTK